MWRRVLRWVKIGVGFGLVIVGLIFAPVPFVHGWMFYLPGLAILATEFTWAKRIQDWLKTKFKNVVAKVKAKRAERKENEPGQT